MSFKTEYHVDVSFLHDLTTGGPTNQGVPPRKNFMDAMKKALATQTHPVTGAKLHHVTRNKITRDMERLNEMKEELLTGKDKSGNPLTKLQMHHLPKQIRSIESKLHKKEEKKNLEDWETVITNCKNQNLDEVTREKILEAANMHKKSSKFDIFTILWGHLEIYNKIEVLEYLKTQNFSNHSLLGKLQSNIREKILEAANMHEKSSKFDIFTILWGHLQLYNKIEVLEYLKTQNFPNHILLGELQSNIDYNFPSQVTNEQNESYFLEDILRSANLSVKGPLDKFATIWNSLNTASKTIVQYFLKKNGVYRKHMATAKQA